MSPRSTVHPEFGSAEDTDRGSDGPEQKLRDSQEEFRAFFDSVAVGHVLIEARSSRFVRVNARFCEITGYTAEELFERTLFDITVPEDHPHDSDRIAKFRSGYDRDIEQQKRYIRKDGTVIWVQLTTSVIRHPDGSPRLFVAVVQDITAQKRAEIELRESQAQLRLAIDSAALGTFYYDQKRGLNQWSQRMRSMLGIPPNAVPGPELFLQAVHPEDRRRLTDEWMRVHRLEYPEDFQTHFRVVWRDGTVRHIDLVGRATPTHDADGATLHRLIGTTRDVTALQHAEAELHKLVAERTAALAEKTAQLESFCYTVAHDLRSPLRAIGAHADMLRQDFAGAIPSDAVTYLDKINRSAERLDALIRDLLTYSRIVQVNIARSDVPLMSAVTWAVRQLEPEIKAKGAKVTVVQDMPVVRADRSLLDQICLNLISNALKYVPEGRQPDIHVRAEQRGTAVRLLVRDNGIGIPEQYHDRIFRAFERLADASTVAGTGVGLAVVARAAERLGGSVGLKSTPGEGSTFWIELEKAALL